MPEQPPEPRKREQFINPQQPPQGQQPLPPPMYQYPPQDPYGPRQPAYAPPKKKHNGVWIAVAVVLVVGVVTCGVVGMASSGTTKVATDTTSTSSSSSSGSGNTVVKVGQSIIVDDVSCTATSAHKLQGDDVVTPKRGNEFVVVHVKMVNNGQSDQTYNPYDFHAKSSSGNVTDTEVVPPSSYTANNTLDSGTLAPGGKVEGDMIFQIPVGDVGAELTWSPSFFNTSSQYAWVLNVK